MAAKNTNVVKFEGAVPATLRKVAVTHAAVVQEVTGKGILFTDMYDCSYRAGWCSSSDPVGVVHSDSGTTVAELAGRIRTARRCDCVECREVK